MKKYTTIFVFVLVVFLSAGTIFAQPGPQGPGLGGQVPYGFNGPQGPGPGGQGAYGFSGPQGFSGQTGYGFPGQLQTVTVTQVRTFGHKMPVAIKGNLVQFYGGKDLYIFRDSSGDIIVKIGPKEWQNLWYQGITIDPSDTIEIYGEVHWPRHSWGTPEVHARFIKKGL